MIPAVAVEAAMAQLDRAKDIGYSPWWTVQNILDAAAPHMTCKHDNEGDGK